MKTRDEFIGISSPGEISFQEKKEEYNIIREKIAELESNIKPYYDELKDKKYVSYESVEEAIIEFYRLLNLHDESKKNEEKGFTFIDQHDFYYTIDYLERNKRSELFKNKGIDLEKLGKELLEEYEDLSTYIETYIALDLAKTEKSSLEATINLGAFDGKHDHRQCTQEGHFFIKLGRELRCVYCGFTTEDYDLSDNDLEFLESVMKGRRCLLEDATEEDLPLIEVIKRRQDKSIAPYDTPFSDDIMGCMDEMDKEDEDSFTIGRMAYKMREIVKMGHKMDRKDYIDERGNPIYNPKYLNENVVKEKLKEIDEQIDKASIEDIPQLKVQRFVILILSGKPLEQIYKGLEKDDDIDSFVTAYGNLDYTQFRKDSGFFQEMRIIGDKLFNTYYYPCTTANPEINKRLLKLMDEGKLASS